MGDAAFQIDWTRMGKCNQDQSHRHHSLIQGCLAFPDPAARRKNHQGDIRLGHDGHQIFGCCSCPRLVWDHLMKIFAEVLREQSIQVNGLTQGR